MSQDTLIYSTEARGGATIAKIASLATTNATLVKVGEGRLVGWVLTNTTAAFKFVRIYHLAVAPTVGTSVPVLIIAIPPNTYVTRASPVGSGFVAGLAYSITNLVGDLDATAVAAGDVVGGLFYA